MQVTDEMIRVVEEYKYNELLNQQVTLLESILQKIKDREMHLKITEVGEGEDWEGIRLNFSYEYEVAKMVLGEE